MNFFDVFNGDADGICALQQLRLARPAQSRRITGVKRDIQLLQRVFPERGDSVTVLDVSLESNRADLVRILDAGAEVSYFDHHDAGVVPEHPLLRTHLSRAADVCTSLLVDEFLDGAHRLWAVVGAFGDNLDDVAERVAAPLLGGPEIERLRELGRLLNYNGYGGTVEDLLFAPDALFERLHPYGNPLEFAEDDEAFLRLRDGHASDMALAANLEPEVATSQLRVYVLPNAPWSRRISGTMANDLIRRRPDVSHALLVPNTAACYMVSVRVPRDGPRRADAFCRQFETGGGRATAGGINHLPSKNLEDFVRRFRDAFS
jgi:hypothetical protein